MTKSTITRERIEQYANDPRMCNINDEIRELARMALAAMDSEPVAYMHDGEDGTEYNGHNEFSGGGKGIPLYRHAQQPVDSDFIPKNLDKALGVVGVAIPESREEFNFQAERWVQRLIDRVIRYADEFQEQPAPVVPKEMPCGGAADDYHDEYQDGWNACRAAMLAAAPQDTSALNSVQSVVTVPGKWIPVSDRMPDVGDIVLTAMGGVVNVGEMECSAANCRFFTSVISGRELPATHWMPLPSAPQEVNHG